MTNQTEHNQLNHENDKVNQSENIMLPALEWGYEKAIDPNIHGSSSHSA